MSEASSRPPGEAPVTASPWQIVGRGLRGRPAGETRGARSLKTGFWHARASCQEPTQDADGPASRGRPSTL